MEILTCISAAVFLGICSLEDFRRKAVHMSLIGAGGAYALILFVLMQAGSAQIISFSQLVLRFSAGAAVLLFSGITKGGIGEGDGLVFLILGLFLDGWMVLEVFVTALFLSAGAAGFLLVFRKKSGRDRIPFLPFAEAAYLMILLAGRISAH